MHGGTNLDTVQGVIGTADQGRDKMASFFRIICKAVQGLYTRSRGQMATDVHAPYNITPDGEGGRSAFITD